MNELAKHFGVRSPEVLFAAFPDFFPPEFQPKRSDFPAETLRLLRELILQAPPPLGECRAERVMGSHNRFSPRWWRDRLAGMSPASIRRQTGNPRGRYGRLLIGYCEVTRRKLREFWRFRRGPADGSVKARIAAEERLDSLLK